MKEEKRFELSGLEVSCPGLATNSPGNLLCPWTTCSSPPCFTVYILFFSFFILNIELNFTVAERTKHTGTKENISIRCADTGKKSADDTNTYHSFNTSVFMVCNSGIMYV